MKRLLLPILLLSIPALASAQAVVSETWTTYCDGTTEKVRMTLVFHIDVGRSPHDFSNGDFTSYAGDCSGCSNSGGFGPVLPLGGGDYQSIGGGWLRSCLLGPTVTRSFRIYWREPDGEGGDGVFYLDLHCADGPQPIIDSSTCVPLPVPSRTWGAIKALYEPKGGKP